MCFPRRLFGTREDKLATIVSATLHIFWSKDNEYLRLLMVKVRNDSTPSNSSYRRNINSWEIYRGNPLK